MSANKDIENLEDIKLLVDSFYTKVRADIVLAHIFNRVIEDRWPQHLEKMYTFWETVLLEGYSYSGSPFMKHAKLPVDGKHFEQWQKLFFETIDESFSGPKANEAKWRANKMAEMFEAKIEYYRNNPSTTLL